MIVAERWRLREENTAEALSTQSKKFLIKNYFDVCELRGREKKSPSALRPGSGRTATYLNCRLRHSVRAEALEA
jgi:hypothetical protein